MSIVGIKCGILLASALLNQRPMLTVVLFNPAVGSTRPGVDVGWMILCYLAQIPCTLSVMAECALIGLHALGLNRASTLSIFCPRMGTSNTYPETLNEVSPALITGFCMMLDSVLLRRWALRQTPKLNYSDSKKGLCTSGPYAYVRYPLETSTLLHLLGIATSCLLQGSYISECQLNETTLVWVVRGWIALLIYLMATTLRRGVLEDERLWRVHGKAWKEYSDAVPYRYIPKMM